MCRGYPIEQLAVKSSHLETAYLLIYGVLPTQDQYNNWKQEITHHSVVHADAEGFFRSFRQVYQQKGNPFKSDNKFRYDAHPMAILTSAFAYLGSYYSEANPSLRGKLRYTLRWIRLTGFLGQKLYTQGDAASLAVIDRQIYRLIGKATTLAAFVHIHLTPEKCH